VDPITIGAIGAVADVKRALDTAALKRTVEDVKTAVDGIGKHLDEEVLIDVRSGFDHLDAAVRAWSDALQREELGHARGYFTRLANRTGGAAIEGLSERLSGDEVCALGHFGNYHYFLLQDEPEQALIAAYSCAERFPVLGARFLPAALFSIDYGASLGRAEKEGELLRRSHALALPGLKERQRKRRLDLAWRVPAATGTAVAGIAGMHPAIWIGGFLKAKEILANATPAVPPPPSTQALAGHAQKLDALLGALGTEARERRQALEAGAAVTRPRAALGPARASTS
jgi:hypothetical protein